MFSTLGIVEVHAHSSDPGHGHDLRSWAGRKFGGKPLLEWVVRRVTDAQRLDHVVVVCGEGPRQLIQDLVPPDISVFAGREPDALGRFAAALEKFPAEAIVRVRLDRPFIDPALIDQLVASADAAPGCDYVTYCFSDGRPVIHSPLGMFAEWCRPAAIRLANREAADPLDRADATRYLSTHPELFMLRFCSVPPQLDRDDFRLALELEEDWDHAQAIFEALGADSLEWQRIARLLDQHPAMRQRMAALNRVGSGV
jgi:spore coat polysaccharide biosynthesis protein SpsF